MKIEILEVAGIGPAIKAMRLPMKSGEKSDSFVCYSTLNGVEEEGRKTCPHRKYVILSTNRNDKDVLFECRKKEPKFIIGPKDHQLSMKLCKAGSDHRKHIRLIDVWVEIQAPLYWWKEFDTYRMGVDKVSESTMHTLMKKKLTEDDFEGPFMGRTKMVKHLNNLIAMYQSDTYKQNAFDDMNKSLPQSYLQTRICKISYEALRNMYHARKNHKLKEWRTFCEWIETLPYSEFITGKE